MGFDACCESVAIVSGQGDGYGFVCRAVLFDLYVLACVDESGVFVLVESVVGFEEFPALGFIVTSEWCEELHLILFATFSACKSGSDFEVIVFELHFPVALISTNVFPTVAWVFVSFHI